MVSLNDRADRAPLPLADGQVIELGGTASSTSAHLTCRTAGKHVCSSTRPLAPCSAAICSPTSAKAPPPPVTTSSRWQRSPRMSSERPASPAHRSNHPQTRRPRANHTRADARLIIHRKQQPSTTRPRHRIRNPTQQCRLNPCRWLGAARCRMSSRSGAMWFTSSAAANAPSMLPAARPPSAVSRRRISGPGRCCRSDRSRSNSWPRLEARRGTPGRLGAVVSYDGRSSATDAGTLSLI